MTQYVGTIPEFPYSPRCLFSSTFFWLFWPAFLHTHTHWKMCYISWTTLNHTTSQMTGDRWPNPQQQMTCSFTEVHFSVTCEILDEHTDCSRCTSCVGPRWRADLRHTTNWIQQNLWRHFWENRGGARFLHKHWRKNKAFKVDYCCSTSMSLKIVPVLIFTYWAAFLAAPTIGSNIFLLCLVPFTFVLQKIQWDSNGFVAIASHFHRRDPGLWDLFGIWSHKPNFMDVVCSPRGPSCCVGNAKSLSVVLERR